MCLLCLCVCCHDAQLQFTHVSQTAPAHILGSSVYDGIEIVRQEVPAPSNTLGVVSYEGIEIMRAAEQPAEDPLVDEEFAGIEIVRTELPIQPAADAVSSWHYAVLC